MTALLLLLLILPLVATAVTGIVGFNTARLVTVFVGATTFVASLALIPNLLQRHHLELGSLVRVDALSEVFLLATAFLYFATAIFTGGYLRVNPTRKSQVYSRRFYAGLNLFCWSMVVAPLVNGLALLWIAIEVTTVVSALLVAIDETDRASEASWKYVLIASLGLGIALFATILMYYAGSKVFGPSYDLSYVKLLSGAPHFAPAVVRLSFVLAVLGYGTKMGLVPVHTWLPDAHSEAPTPVSALLSGSLLTVSFYAILRFFQIAVRTIGGDFPRDTMLVFGVASILLAALYLLSQRDLKRLLAYSSVEHMGILTIGMSFAAPLAIFGVLLHVLTHACAKGTAFFGAGSITRKFLTKDLSAIRGGVGLLPYTGPLFVAAVLALSALPPFGIFRSEFLIVSGGLRDPHDAAAAVLVVLITVSFFGLSWSTTKAMLSPTTTALGHGGVPAPERGEVSRWIVLAMVIGLVALIVLGVHVPGQLSEILHRASRELAVPK